MKNSYSQLFTQSHPKSVTGRVIQFPITRIIIAVLFILPYLLFHNNVIADSLAAYIGPLRSLFLNTDVVLSLAILLLIYSLYVKWIEKRKAFEISPKVSLMEFGVGFLISFALVGFMVLLMALLGYYRISQLGPPEIILDVFFSFGMGAFIQVLFFRLILFRLSEEILGSWLAFLLTAMIFAFFHLGNENITLWTTISMIITDILFFAAFMYTRRLWLVWGLHMSHNFFQDGIFGMPNSGITSLNSWIQPEIAGPQWITGGGFGIEASVIFVLLSLVVGLIILKMTIAKNQIVLPLWKRKKSPNNKPKSLHPEKDPWFPPTFRIITFIQEHREVYRE